MNDGLAQLLSSRCVRNKLCVCVCDNSVSGRARLCSLRIGTSRYNMKTTYPHIYKHSRSIYDTCAQDAQDVQR